VVGAEHHRFGLDRTQPVRVGTAEGEHGLVRVPGQQHRLRGAAQGADQLQLLRVEVLGVVHHEVANPLSFGGQQLRVGGQRVERRGHQLGGVQGRRGGLWRATAGRPAQQDHVFVGAEEAAGGGPFGDVVPPPQLGQLDRAEAAFGRAQQQLTQLGGKPGQADRRPEP
jgi:hypothetical protein